MRRERSARVTAIIGAVGLLAGATVLLILPAEAGPRTCPRPPAALSFAAPKYLDRHRAGGEPTVEQLPDGTMIYGAHAGTTHFYAPAGADPTTAAFVENYSGQTYYYFSKDNGRTWTFAPREAPDNLPGQGFSDPESAYDKAGNLYVSEINLANVAVSKSTDSGRTYKLQNFFGQTIHDRQWMAADEKNVLYIVGNSFGGGTAPTQPVGNFGHFLYKSTDGGQTFSAGILDEKNGSGLGDLQVDKSDGTLYEAHYNGNLLSLAAFRHARDDKFAVDVNPVARNVNMLSHWPAFNLDPQGNLYMVWDESGRGGRAAGIWYSYSTTRGNTWSTPERVDPDNKTDIWPWLAVGSRGRVAIAYLEASKKLPNHDAETPGNHGWRVVAAQSLNGLGCTRSRLPGFRRATATEKPVHRGTICQGGTACQAMGIDRRMGDFFTIEIDRTGAMWAGYSDTRQGGAVALPGFVRQAGGPSFVRRN